MSREIKLGNAGLELIKKKEGFRANAYLCPANKWTVGYGTTIYSNGSAVKQGDTITESEAVALLKSYVENNSARTLNNVLNTSVTLEQNQVDALLSWMYNIGDYAAQKSSLMKLVNINPNDEAIVGKFLEWSVAKVDGKKKRINGLLQRRCEEAQLYFSHLNGFNFNAVLQKALNSLGSDGLQISYMDTYVPIALKQSKIYDYNTLMSGSVSLNGEENNLFYNSLFISPFYLFQNENTEIMDENAGKAILWLHTLPIDVKSFENGFFTTDGACHTSFIETEYINLLYLGGLLWRMRRYKEKGKDVINFPNEYYHPYGEIINMIPSLRSKSLFHKMGDKYYFCYGTEYNIERYNKYLEDCYNVKLDWLENLDLIIVNKLIDIFLNFVNGEWLIIKQCCELQFKVNDDNTSIQMTPQVFKYFMSFLNDCVKDNKYLTFLEVMCGKKNIKVRPSEEDSPYGNEYILKIRNFLPNYCSIYPMNADIAAKVNTTNYIGIDNTFIQMFYSESNPINRIFHNLMSKKAVILLTGLANQVETMTNTVNKTYLQSYLDGFVTQVDEYMKKRHNEAHNESNVDTKSTIDKDNLLAIYMYIKNFWDRWGCAYYNSEEKIKNEFKVVNYFKNFVFMDSFYLNISHKLKMNCQEIYDIHMGYGDKNNVNVFSYCAEIAKRHHCNLFVMPDFIPLGMSDENSATETLKNVFKPIPANFIGTPQQHNSFVFVYSHELSSIVDGKNDEFKSDSFDLIEAMNKDDGNSVFSISEAIPIKNDQDLVTRFGYYIPSFGVSYSRQNNHIFTSLNVAMTTPQMTEIAARNTSNIVEYGNSNAKKITFYGQDIYPIYSNYSYTIEVEMMGNAQIQPLMYFQLLNVPLFRGTYMIIKVSHQIQSGNMTTKFTGVKLSRYAMPFTTNWFILPPITDEESDEELIDRSLFSSVTVSGDISGYQKLYDYRNKEIKISDCKLGEVISEYLGVPYVLGGKDKTGIDCSGFTKVVYKNVYNIDLPDGCIYQYDDCKKNGSLKPVIITNKSYDDIKYAKVGDILFCYGNKDDKLCHVMIYIGIVNNIPYVAHASSSKGVCCVPLVNSSLASGQKCKWIGQWSRTINNENCSGNVLSNELIGTMRNSEEYKKTYRNKIYEVYSNKLPNTTNGIFNYTGFALVFIGCWYYLSKTSKTTNEQIQKIQNSGKYLFTDDKIKVVIKEWNKYLGDKKSETRSNINIMTFKFKTNLIYLITPSPQYSDFINYLMGNYFISNDGKFTCDNDVLNEIYACINFVRGVLVKTQTKK